MKTYLLIIDDKIHDNCIAPSKELATNIFLMRCHYNGDVMTEEEYQLDLQESKLCNND